MMYEVSKKDYYNEELQEAMNAHSKNGTFIKNAIGINKLDFENEILKKLMNCRNWMNLKRHISALVKKGLIGNDDYSFVAFRE